MAGNIKGITIEIGGNTTKLQSALSGVNKTIKDTGFALRDINKLLKLDPKNVELLRQKQENLKTAIQGTKEKLDTERRAMEQLKSADQTPEVVRQQQELQRAIIEDEQRLKSLENEFRSFGSVAKQQMIAVGESIKQAGTRITEFGDKIKGFGTTMTTRVTAPIVGIGAASIKAFNEVDAGLDTIAAKTGASGDDLEQMGKAMENIATSIPTDFQTAGAAIGEVNTRFGLTGQELEDLSEDFLKFAQLNKTDVSNSIDQVQKMMAAYGVDAQDASKVLDLLNATGQKTGISMDNLAASMVTNGSTMRELGFGVAESAEFLGKLETSGIDASTVMTGLKRAMANAAQDGVGLEDAMRGLQEEMMSAESNTAAMEKAIDLFGTRAGPQFAEAIRSGVINMEDLLNSSIDLETNIGNLDSTFENTQDAYDKFKTTMNQVTLAGRELGAAILTTVTPMLDKLSETIKNVTEWFRSLSDEQREMIVKVALVAAAIGPVLVLAGTAISVIGRVVSGVGSLIQVLAGLASPIGIVVVAIGALVAAFTYLYTSNEEFRNKVNEVFEAVREKITAVIEQLKIIFESFKELCAAIWAEWGDSIMNTVQTIFGAIADVISGVLTVVQGIIQTVLAVIQGDWQGAWEGIKMILSGAWEAMRGIVTAVLTSIRATITTILTVIQAVFTTVWSAIQAAVSSIINAIKAVISSVMNAIKSNISTVLNSIKSTFSSVWNAIKSTVSTVINAIKSTISTGMNAMESSVSSVLNGIKSTFTSVFDGIKSHVSGVVDWLKKCFDFNWSLPQIKLPHFKISGGFSLNPPSVPSFGIEWYKKAYDKALAFTSPTVLPTPSGFKGFGDGNGAEIVIGENKLMSSINKAAGAAETSAKLDLVTELLIEYLPELANTKIYMDKNALVGEIAPAMNRQLGIAYRG